MLLSSSRNIRLWMSYLDTRRTLIKHISQSLGGDKEALLEKYWMDLPTSSRSCPFHRCPPPPTPIYLYWNQRFFLSSRQVHSESFCYSCLLPSSDLACNCAGGGGQWMYSQGYKQSPSVPALMPPNLATAASPWSMSVCLSWRGWLPCHPADEELWVVWTLVYWPVILLVLIKRHYAPVVLGIFCENSKGTDSPRLLWKILILNLTSWLRLAWSRQIWDAKQSEPWLAVLGGEAAVEVQGHFREAGKPPLFTSGFDLGRPATQGWSA